MITAFTLSSKQYQPSADCPAGHSGGTENGSDETADFCYQSGGGSDMLSSFFCEETKNEIFSQSFHHFDYIVDAIDTVSSKLLLIQTAKNENIPIISSMGAANKLDPTRFRVTDIYKTAMDPLAKVMRRELKKLGIPKLKVVCSDEPPLTPVLNLGETKNNRPAPASVAWVPSVAGLILAGEVIKDLIKK